MKLKSRILMLVAGACLLGSSAKADPAVDALVADLNARIAQKKRDLVNCGARRNCQIKVDADIKALTLSVQDLKAGGSIHPRDTGAAFKFFFDQFPSRMSAIERNLEKCLADGRRRASCKAAALAMENQMHADELLGRRAFDQYALAELIRLKELGNSCSSVSSSSQSSSQASSASGVFTLNPEPMVPKAGPVTSTPGN